MTRSADTADVFLGIRPAITSQDSVSARYLKLEIVFGKKEQDRERVTRCKKIKGEGRKRERREGGRKQRPHL